MNNFIKVYAEAITRIAKTYLYLLSSFDHQVLPRINTNNGSRAFAVVAPTIYTSY